MSKIFLAKVLGSFSSFYLTIKEKEKHLFIIQVHIPTGPPYGAAATTNLDRSIWSPQSREYISTFLKISFLIQINDKEKKSFLTQISE